MHPADPYMARVLVDMRVEEELRLAEARRLARQAAGLRRRAPFQRARWLCCQLGYFLVALGARLDELAPEECALAC
jgi:hypothetical protein